MKRGELFVARRAVLRCDLQSPGQRRRAAEKLLIEPIAQPADGLCHEDRRRYRIEHGRKGNSAAPRD